MGNYIPPVRNSGRAARLRQVHHLVDVPQVKPPQAGTRGVAVNKAARRRRTCSVCVRMHELPTASRRFQPTPPAATCVTTAPYTDQDSFADQCRDGPGVQPLLQEFIGPPEIRRGRKPSTSVHGSSIVAPHLRRPAPGIAMWTSPVRRFPADALTRDVEWAGNRRTGGRQPRLRSSTEPAFRP